MSTNFQIISKTAPLLNYLKKQRENERVMKTSEIAITFLFISFFTILAIQPAVTTISALLGEIKSKELLTMSMKNKINQVIAAQDSFAQIQERYPVINASLPDSQNYSQLLPQILGCSNDAESQVKRLLFDTKEQGKSDELSTSSSPNIHIKSFSVSFNSQSNYSSGIKFLNCIRTNRRLMAFETLGISPEKDTATNQIDPSKINLRMTLKSYYWLPENK